MRLTKSSKRLIISAFFVVLLLIAGTYAWIRIGYNANNAHKLVAGTLDLTLDESTSEGIHVEKAIPIPYREGITTTEYTFSLENTGQYTTGYKISFENEDEFENSEGETVTITDDNRIADKYIRYLLVKNGEDKKEENSKLVSEADERVIDSGILAATEKNDYILQVWIDYDAGDNGTTPEVMDRFFNVKLRIDAIQADGTSDDGQSHKKYALVFNGNGGSSKTLYRDSNEAVGEMPVSEREGYTFLGWFTAAEGGTEITTTTPINSEKETYYAHWSINQYRVSFDGNGGTNGTEIYDDYNKELGTLSESTRTGYTFLGWYTEKTGGQKINPTSKIPAKDVTYYAHWSINQYRVSFDGNEGTDGADIVGDYDTELGDLPTSIRRGYIFAGWFTEAEGGEQITEHTKIGAGDVTYYAHWIIDFFDVTYDYATNGGTSADKESDVVINTEDIDLTPVAYKTGYEFVGWNTNKDATEGLTSLKMGQQPVTLYAIYRKQVTATFVGNGANVSTSAVSCYIYNNGTTCTSEANAPAITRESYVVKGYSTQADSTDKEANAPIQGQKFQIGLNGATYYAITLQIQTATAYYYGTSSQATTNLTCTMYNTDTKCIYPLPPEVTGSAGPDETEYVGLSKTKSSTTLEEEINSENSKYYSVYEKEITSTFYYYDEGVKTATSKALRIATTDESLYATEFKPVVIPNEVVTSTGPNNYDYSGISKDTNSQTAITEVTSKYKKYYAFYNGVWTVGYSKDAATVDSIGKTSDSCDNFASTNETTYTTVGVNCDKTLPVINEKRGYTKDGWYEGTTRVGTSEGSYTITKDTSLVGKATINKYTVTYNATANGGTTSATEKSFDFAEDIDLSPTATKEGYDFLGWNTDRTATNGLTSLVMDTDNVILYAIFKKSTTISLESISPTEYTGSPIVANQAVVADGSASPVITYHYYLDDACETPTPTTSGASTAGEAPIDVLYNNEKEVIPYYVQAEVAAVDGDSAATTYKGAKSNCMPHKIIPKNVSVVWGETEFDYNGNQQGPTASITSVIPGETLAVTRTMATNAGSHTSHATVTVTGGRNKMENYEVTNPEIIYNINRIDNTLTLSADQDLIYGTNTATFTVEENVSGGELSVIDDNATADVSITGNTVTISNLKTINANTTVKVTVTSGATTNYKQASTIYNLTVIKKNPTLTVASSKELTYGTNGKITYTYDGDGVVSCASADEEYVTCSVDENAKEITLVPVKATETPVVVTLSATYGTNYNQATNQTINVTVAKKVPKLVVNDTTKTVKYDETESSTYTYDGDGQVVCSSADTSYLTCEVDTANNKILYKPKKVTPDPIDVTISVVSGTNYGETTSKVVSVTLEKATPVITISATSGSMHVGESVTYTESVNVAGHITNSIDTADSEFVSISPGSIDPAANVTTTVTVTGGKTNGTKAKSVPIKVYFTPNDTTNYNTISAEENTSASKTYTATVNPYVFRATFTKGSNVDEIEATAASCTTRNSNITCTVNAPEIYPDEGYESQGWSRVSGSATPNTVADGGTITLSGDAEYTTVVAAVP